MSGLLCRKGKENEGKPSHQTETHSICHFEHASHRFQADELNETFSETSTNKATFTSHIVLGIHISHNDDADLSFDTYQWSIQKYMRRSVAAMPTSTILGAAILSDNFAPSIIHLKQRANARDTQQRARKAQKSRAKKLLWPSLSTVRQSSARLRR